MHRLNLLNLGVKNMTLSREFDRMFDHLNQAAVGFGPLFKEFTQTHSTYPPHNIVALSDTEFCLELALAGFKKSEITVKEQDGVLTVSSDKSESVASTQAYQYRGIGMRSFSKSFRIAEHFEIKDATMEDGILSINFVKDASASQAKVIAIK